MDHELLVGDFNEDNEINLDDYMMILRKRGKKYNETTKMYDLNNDKKIDDSDADIVAENCTTFAEDEDYNWQEQQANN